MTCGKTISDNQFDTRYTDFQPYPEPQVYNKEESYFHVIVLFNIYPGNNKIRIDFPPTPGQLPPPLTSGSSD